MGHDCLEPSTCSVCHPERGYGIDMVPDAGPYFNARIGIPVAEHERDDVTDCDRVRRIVLGAVDVFLSVCLHTPGDHSLDVERLFGEVKATAVPTVREYRTRQRQRFATAVAATGRLGEPDIAEAIPGSSSREPSPEDLTCEDP